MVIGKKIIEYDKIDSTNDEARRLIEKGEGEGTVIVAREQTKGKGKLGSGWFSPPDHGIYLSTILKPFKNPKDIASITVIGAEAVVKSIKKSAGISADIKLPNDVMIKGKKIAGILTERVPSGHLIIGIGVNINNPAGSFPEELKDKATSLRIETGTELDIRGYFCALISELDAEYLAYLRKI